MKTTMCYLMMILFLVSLLIGHLGCAHMPHQHSEEMTVRSAEGPELNTPATEGGGLRVAKGATIGLVGGTGLGALIGAAFGASVALMIASGTYGAGILLLPYLAGGGAAIGGAIGGVSGTIAGVVISTSTPKHDGIVYNKWKGILFVQVDSLQPVLQWKSFPTDKDIKADKTGELSRVSDVTYELKILRAQDSYQGEVVYTRTGLQEPSHRVERSLISLTRYFWSVRVRFRVDDEYRETGWIHGSPFYTTM